MSVSERVDCNDVPLGQSETINFVWSIHEVYCSSKPPQGIVIKNAVDKFCFECKGSPEVKYWIRYGWCSVIKRFNDQSESCFNTVTIRNAKLQGQLNNHRTLINL